MKTSSTVEHERREKARSNDKGERCAELAAMSVLIADDHPVFRRGLREVFEEDERVRVIGEAADGQEALHVIQNAKPDVAVLDIRMPKLSGLQVARAIKERELATRVVMLTMYPDAELFDEAMDLGTQGYVLKENAVADVLNAVQSIAQGQFFISQSLSGLLVGRRAGARKLERERDGVTALSPAERRVLCLIASDKTSKEIAAELEISVRTVDSHRQNISEKLNLRGSHSLLKFAFDHKSALQSCFP